MSAIMAYQCLRMNANLLLCNFHLLLQEDYSRWDKEEHVLMEAGDKYRLDVPYNLVVIGQPITKRVEVWVMDVFTRHISWFARDLV